MGTRSFLRYTILLLTITSSILWAGLPASAQEIPSLALGQSATGTLTSPSDVRYYRLTAPDGGPIEADQHLIILLNKTGGWVGRVSIRPGDLPVPGDGTTTSSPAGEADQAVEVQATQAGDYFISVDGAGLGSGSYSLGAYTPDSMPQLTLGAPQADRLADRDDVKWYRVQAPGAQHLLVFLDKTGGWYGQVCARLGLLPTPGDAGTIASDTANSDQAIEVTSTQSGDYFVRVDGATWGWGTYTLAATTAAMMPALASGTTYPDALRDPYDVRWYRIPLAAGQRTLVSVTKPGWWGLLSARIGGLPAPGGADTVSGQAGYSNQAVELTSGQTADCFIRMDGREYGYGAYTVTASVEDTIPTLTLGAPRTDTLSNRDDVKWYRVRIRPGEHLLVTLDKTGPWYGRVSVREGDVPVPGGADTITSACDYYDQAVDIVSTSGGDYFIMVDGDGWGWGPYTITASVSPTLDMGLPKIGRVTDPYDRKWHRVRAAAGQHVIVMLDKAGGWWGQVTMRAGGLPSPGDADTIASGCGYSDQAVDVIAAESADYFIQVDGCGWEAGSYTITALTADLLPTLTFGITKAGELRDRDDVRWYRLQAPEGPPGQHILVFLHKDTTWYSGLRGRPGLLPGGEGTVGDECADLEQGIAIPAGPAGDYFVRVDGAEFGWGKYAIRAELGWALPPTVTSVTPAYGGNAGVVTVAINGKWFDPAAGVALRREGHPGVVPSLIWWGNSSEMVARFDLRGVAGGWWQLVLWNPGPTYAAPVGFEVQQGGEPNLWVDVVGSDRIRVGATSTFVVRYGNSGNIDATYPWLAVGLPWRVTYTVDVPWALPQGPEEPEPPPLEEAVHVTLIDLPFLPPSSSDAINMTVTSPAAGEIAIRARITIDPTPYFKSLLVLPELVWGDEPLGNLYSIASETHLIDQDWRDLDRTLTPPAGYVMIWDYRAGPKWSFHIAKSIGGGNFVEMTPDPSGPDLRQNRLTTQDLEAEYPYYVGALKPPDYSVEHGEKVKTRAEHLLAMFGQRDEDSRWQDGLCKSDIEHGSRLVTNCIGGFHILNPEFRWHQPPLVSIDQIFETLDPEERLWDAARGAAKHRYAGYAWPDDPCYEMFEDVQKGTGINISAVGAIDPNEKAGSIGFGGEGWVGEWTGACPPDSWDDCGYVAGNRPLHYIVRFENLPEATAEAENIVITDTLDPNLDWSTLFIGDTQVGGQSYQPTVVLNPATRTIAWSFAGVNLPPNQNPPEGDGWVSFSINPLPDLPTGTEIHNHASIIFDFNPPMCTNDVIHTIDSGAPSAPVPIQWTPR